MSHIPERSAIFMSHTRPKVGLSIDSFMATS